MCTILILQRVHPEYPVVIAANRDEFYARPSTPPAVLAEGPRVIGGRDEQSGGTWMGAAATGLFVGLTNQRTYSGADPSLRSRGEVVLDALRAGEASAATRLLESLDARAYNPFNLVYGDANGLRVAYARADSARIAIAPVPDGVHVLPNDRLDSTEFPKVERARRLTPTEGHLQALADLLGDHHRPPIEVVEQPPPDSFFTRELARELHAVCIHTPSYGTKSATIVALAPGAVASYLFADGPPCTTGFEDVTALLRSP